ncbi:MAG: TOBE domain-containing protein, partial [Halomonas sp.]
PAWRDQGGLETPLGPLPLSHDFGDTEQGVACIRPEQLTTETQEWSLGTATVIDSAFFGAHYRCHLRSDRAPNLTLVAYLPPNAEPKAGSSLPLYADPADVSLFTTPDTQEAIA